MKYSRAFIVWLLILSAPSTGAGAAWLEGRTMPSSPPAGLAVTGVVHLQDIGDVALRDGAWAGTKGQSRRLEGFSINFAVPVPGVGMAYMCHLQNGGDTPWMPGGSFAALAGSRGAWKVLPSGSMVPTPRNTTSSIPAIYRMSAMWALSRTAIFAEREDNRGASKQFWYG